MELFLSFITLLAASCIAQILIDKNEIRRLKNERRMPEMPLPRQVDQASHSAKKVLFFGKYRRDLYLPKMPRSAGAADPFQAEADSPLVLRDREKIFGRRDL